MRTVSVAGAAFVKIRDTWLLDTGIAKKFVIPNAAGPSFR